MFSLISVNVRVNPQHSGFETPVATVGTIWESAADTWTLYLAISTTDLGCLWWDWTNVAWQRPTCGWWSRCRLKKWISQNGLSNETTKNNMSCCIFIQTPWTWLCINTHLNEFHLICRNITYLVNRDEPGIASILITCVRSDSDNAYNIARNVMRLCNTMFVLY